MISGTPSSSIPQSRSRRLPLSWSPLVELLCPYNGPVQYSYIMDLLDTPMSMDLRRKIFLGHPNSCLYRKWTSLCNLHKNVAVGVYSHYGGKFISIVNMHKNGPAVKSKSTFIYINPD